MKCIYMLRSFRGYTTHRRKNNHVRFGEGWFATGQLALRDFASRPREQSACACNIFTLNERYSALTDLRMTMVGVETVFFAPPSLPRPVSRYDVIEMSQGACVQCRRLCMWLIGDYDYPGSQVARGSGKSCHYPSVDECMETVKTWVRCFVQCRC